MASSDLSDRLRCLRTDIFGSKLMACIIPSSICRLTPSTADFKIYTLSLTLLVVFVLSCLYFCLPALKKLNNRIAFGRPRPFDWYNETVVITGGCMGLGASLVEQILEHSKRKVRIAVIDREECMDGKSWGFTDDASKPPVYYYPCDFDREWPDIHSTWEEITRDLGTPTVLVNNAGVKESDEFMKLDGTVMYPDDLVALFKVNTLSQLFLTRLFLSDVMEPVPGNTGKGHRGGTLVTISSVLGLTGAAHLSAYSASKAALLAYHKSLTAELLLHSDASDPASRIKTILVAPGQLDTRMFKHVDPTPQRGWLQRALAGRLVRADILAGEIVQMLASGRGGEIRMPWWTWWIGAAVEGLPAGVSRLARQWSGIDEAVGRAERLGIFQRSG